MLSVHAAYICVYVVVSYAWSHVACLAIDLLLILVVDGVSKNILSEIGSLHATTTTVDNSTLGK